MFLNPLIEDEDGTSLESIDQGCVRLAKSASCKVSVLVPGD